MKIFAKLCFLAQGKCKFCFETFYRQVTFRKFNVRFKSGQFLPQLVTQAN